MPAPPRELTAVYQRRLAAIEDRAERAVVAAWRSDAPLSDIVQLVLAAQRTMVAATDAGLSLAAGVTTGTATTPIGIDPDPLIGVRARHGTTLETVYSRPAKVVRESGFDRGLAYLRGAIAMDARLAHRNAAWAHNMADRRVAHWRRRTRSVAPCGLCIVASMQTYRRGDLQPLHEHCQCTVVEVYTSEPVPQGVYRDDEALRAVYEAAGSTDRRSLTNVRFDVSGEQLAAFPDDVQKQLRALNTRVVFDPEIGPRLDGDRHDLHITIPS